MLRRTFFHAFIPIANISSSALAMTIYAFGVDVTFCAFVNWKKMEFASVIASRDNRGNKLSKDGAMKHFHPRTIILLT